MKIKTMLSMAAVTLFLVGPATQAGQFTIPAAEQAKENGMAPQNSPVIDEEWKLTPRYYIHSDDPALKVLLNVQHEFPGAFSAHLTGDQLAFLESEGIEVEPVRLFYLSGRSVCGDGVCQGNEPKTCPGDCGDPQPEPEPETCFPDDQYPWGIVEVNGGVGGGGVTVAVLDTGVQTEHPDLANRIVSCKDTTKRGIKDGCRDNVGHGTHVAGSIAADGGPNGNGIYGVAPEADLMAIKVCGNTSCWGDDIAEGIEYATDNGAQIISISIGGDNPDYYVLATIDHAVAENVLVIAAAGNDGPTDGSIDYPAAYKKVVAVGAIDINEYVPDWSSRGINDGDYIVEEKEVEFAAPGVTIESTDKDGCYSCKSGTSMATPHVSGLAAKLWQNGALETREYLQSIAIDIDLAGDDPETGLGLPIAPYL
ncbi:MAG: S8 family peptidase [Thermodesulfobacteriota bacterium]|nr:S8 family peptidase [Thermodesulfobacteriota bacterium]